MKHTLDCGQEWWWSEDFPAPRDENEQEPAFSPSLLHCHCLSAAINHASQNHNKKPSHTKASYNICRPHIMCECLFVRCSIFGNNPTFHNKSRHNKPSVLLTVCWTNSDSLLILPTCLRSLKGCTSRTYWGGKPPVITDLYHNRTWWKGV